jgi:hypothetical protein
VVRAERWYLLSCCSVMKRIRADGNETCVCLNEICGKGRERHTHTNRESWFCSPGNLEMEITSSNALMD